MATSLEENSSYKKSYERIKNYYLGNIPKISRAKTKTGREEFKKRMDFIGEFIKQLEDELF